MTRFLQKTYSYGNYLSAESFIKAIKLKISFYSNLQQSRLLDIEDLKTFQIWKKSKYVQEKDYQFFIRRTYYLHIRRKINEKE